MKLWRHKPCEGAFEDPEVSLVAGKAMLDDRPLGIKPDVVWYQ